MSGRRRALVVAVDEHTNPGLRQLAAATGDALALAAALSDPDIAGFDVEVVVNQPSYVTRYRVETFLADSRPDDLTLLHICGVGLTDDRGALFFAGTDTRPEYVRTTALDAALIRQALARCRARQALLVLDCRFGATVRSGSAPPAAGAVDVAEQLGQRNLSGDKRRVLITASAAVESTFEDDQLQAPAPAPSSALTAALVEGLTAGSAARDRDSRVLLDELYDAALARMRTYDPDRSPEKWEFGEGGDAPTVGGPGPERDAGSPLPPPPPSWPPPPPTRLPPPPRPRPHRGRHAGGRSSGAAATASSVRRGVWVIVAVALVGALGLGFLNAVVSDARRSPDPVADSEGATGGAAPADAGVVSVALCEPFVLAPGQTTDACGYEVLGALFSPLVEYDPASSQVLWGSQAPRAVAERVESRDQQTWTVTLKDGWTFHDGTPVTAQSYVDAWNYHAYHPNGAAWAYVFADIEGYDDLQCETDDAGVCTEGPVAEEMRGLTAVDDRTIEVTLSRSFSQFPLVLSTPALSPLPESFYDDPVAYQRLPVGNGPFQMDDEWDHDGDIRLSRYDGYAAEPATIDGIAFHIENDMDAAYDAVLASEVDIVASVPSWRMVEAQLEPGITYVEGWSSLYEYLGFPLDDDRFADPRLRRAISMAINRQAIVDLIAPEYAPADAFVPPGIAGYRGGACGDNCAFDPQRAKQLFDEAGGFEGTMTLWTNTGREFWVEELRDQLRDNLGLTDIEIQTVEFSEYLERLEGGEITGPYHLGWLMDYPSPENYLNLLSTDAPSNYSGWSNRQFDRLIDQGDVAPSIEESLSFYGQAQEVAISAMPNVPLFFEKVGVAHSDRVSNVRVGPNGRLNWADMSVVPRLPNDLS